MRDGRPSTTATWVAACRSLGACLPAEARLCEDPYGARFAGGFEGAVIGLASRHAQTASRVLSLGGPLSRFVAYMQVRTRVLDDVLVEFTRAGGAQVVLLGAGFDCRAVRFRHELDGGTVFEVDFPATQRKKRATLAGVASSRVEYLAWDFEHEATGDLPARLAALGHDRSRPTLIIWEGVTMYLTERAIGDTLAAVRSLGAPRSLLAMTYFDLDRLRRPVSGRVVAMAGEPWRFGWDPDALPGWLGQRGFELLRDETAGEAARRLGLPARWARLAASPGAHVALCRRA
jgi:methyltransferase (TIGR00027 family)